ncbi:hypothetical protein CKM354_001002100 [Cercospora kikuchii]|uniref:Peptidase S8/S53 domain-containing protein n=1 Tax=Cercospora kikuchii TaxID=84275 RepID=A0A9P3CW83_9PEZI|nr:uncharacterized protein CKM354_001002100 [Cercospora kikuchii]GIZ46915.1 hypothetical protein CKM354_001002100 [Cercospora kikuchii]
MRFFTLLLATLPAALAAPSLQPRQANEVVPDRWIVQVRGTSDIERVLAAATDLLRLAQPLEAVLQYDINQDYKGFVVEANESLIRVLATLPDVLAYEPDVWMTGADGVPAEDSWKRQAASAEWAAEPTGTWGTHSSQSPADLSSGEGDFQAAAQQNVFTQSGAEWHLARLSNRPPGSTDYSFHASAGQGSVVYIMDSGIEIRQPDFGGRAFHGANFVPGEPIWDEFGHGTHVAGTIMSGQFGVAKLAEAVNIKVLNRNNQGQLSWFLAGIDWAYRDMFRTGLRGLSVLNLSLGGPSNAQFNAAVNAAGKDGLIIVAAAGNDNIDARQISPANAEEVCTVGGTNINDERFLLQGGGSNFGPALNVFAPGENITSYLHTGPGVAVPWTGTSFAAPAVSGLAAYFAVLVNGQFDSRRMCNFIMELATPGIVGRPGAGSPNLMAYNGIFG